MANEPIPCSTTRSTRFPVKVLESGIQRYRRMNWYHRSTLVRKGRSTCMDTVLEAHWIAERYRINAWLQASI
jgi:hypothetical protein